VFDEAARKDFITGFHKRKTERKQLARQKIAERVRQEKLEARKEKREWLKSQHGVGLGDGSFANAESATAANAAAAASAGAGVNAAACALSAGKSSTKSLLQPSSTKAKKATLMDQKPEAATAASELATYDFEDTLVTTVVTTLEPDGAADQKPLKRAESTRPAILGAQAQRKAKKFDLNLPLSAAIPGYKAPKTLKARKKPGGKKKFAQVSKKEKARRRAPRKD